MSTNVDSKNLLKLNSLPFYSKQKNSQYTKMNKLEKKIPVQEKKINQNTIKSYNNFIYKDQISKEKIQNVKNEEKSSISENSKNFKKFSQLIKMNFIKIKILLKKIIIMIMMKIIIFYLQCLQCKI